MEEVFIQLIKAAAVVLIGYGVYVAVKGIIDKKKIRAEMLKRTMKEAMITYVNNSDCVVKLKDFGSHTELELKGDGIDAEIHEKDVIYA